MRSALNHFTSGQFLAEEAESFHLHLPLGSQTLSVYMCWTISPPDKFMAEEAEFFQFTSASRFTDTCTGVEPFHLWTNSWQRKRSPSSLHLPLGSQTLWCWTFFTFGQYMWPAMRKGTICNSPWILSYYHYSLLQRSYFHSWKFWLNSINGCWVTNNLF